MSEARRARTRYVCLSGPRHGRMILKSPGTLSALAYESERVQTENPAQNHGWRPRADSPDCAEASAAAEDNPVWRASWKRNMSSAVASSLTLQRLATRSRHRRRTRRAPVHATRQRLPQPRLPSRSLRARPASPADRAWTDRRLASSRPRGGHHSWRARPGGDDHVPRCAGRSAAPSDAMRRTSPRLRRTAANEAGRRQLRPPPVRSTAPPHQRSRTPGARREHGRRAPATDPARG